MILTVTPNPCVDKTVFIDEIKIGTFMRSARYTCVPGGKGNNCSRAVKTLGRPTKAMPIVGGHTGAHVVEMIEQQDGVACVPLWVASPTRTITTVVEESFQRQTAFFEPGSRVTQEEYAQICETFSREVANASVVTFNGTVCDPDIKSLYKDLIPIAKAAGAATILDSYGPEFSLGLESCPYMVKPNLAEAEGFAGFPLKTLDARRKVMDMLHERGVELVVLSLGKDGALVSRSGERFHAKPPAINEVNPVGSGDALVAGFAIGVMEQSPLPEVARLAMAAGAANAMSWEIGRFTPEQVCELAPGVQIEAF
jgi:1-phosphofructokinase family hexose kinase